MWESLCEALFPPLTDPVAFQEKLKEYYHSLCLSNRVLLFLLVLFFHLSALFSPYLAPFGYLPLGKRREFLEYCQRRPWRRKLLQFLKLFLGGVYFSLKEVQQSISYSISPLAKPAPVKPFSLESHSVGEWILSEKEVKVDVVVVGSGAGGSVVANRLAQEGLKVLVLEEGREYTQRDFQGDLPLRMYRMYRDNGSTVTLGRPPILLPLGRTVGGTTVVNSGTCFALPSFVWREWKKQRGLSLDEKTFYHFVEEIWQNLKVAPVPFSIMGKNGKILLQGAQELGVSAGPISRPMGNCVGTGICIAGCPFGGKLDMRLTYLKMAKQKGALVAAPLRVEKILWKGAKAIGVEGRHSERARPFRVFAKAVVVSCGAIYTPLLLSKSGYRHPLLGKNLHIHPAYTTGGIFNEAIEGWRGVMQSAYVDEWIQEGILIEATFPHPPLGYGSGILPDQSWIEKYPYLAEVGFLVSDVTMGHVKKRGGKPLIFYSLSNCEMERILRGIYYAGKILFAAGAEVVLTGLPGVPPLRSERELKALQSFPKRAEFFSLAAFHPMGTCSLGKDEKSGVVDLRGRPFGTEGLYVADASLIPTSIHVNPQITIMALSEMVASSLLGDLR